ncbi:MAG: sigma-54-dependent Fis family transcriptional regulator [Magnetococcales bacterium]|nr:sigma-54-dependent Fis family transcriptional regulator [Magnetococcales bacterium]NGZ26536.1 sigma-54-dependent Fis family transcriptional regulator [Magnetococcales bacterium]
MTFFDRDEGDGTVPGKGGGSLPVVLVDDEAEILFSAAMWLESEGLGPVVPLGDSREVIPFLEKSSARLVVLDLWMPHLSGTELLPRLVQSYPAIPVIVMTASQEVETAVTCMKHGAFDYLVKPVDPETFVSRVQKAIEWYSLRQEITELKDRLLSGRLRRESAFANIITSSRKMFAVFQYLEAVASSLQPVFITGETGVGKELIARAVHEVSGRSGAFVAENVAGLDEHVFSDTLFGHKRGAFTGADRDRSGLIAKANGGTLFLDEIGDIKPTLQVKLLRLLQENLYYPLGSDEPVRHQARIILATNRDLKQEVKKGAFREDLYYRLVFHHVHLPPLRQRMEDLPLLIHYFVEEAAAEMNKTPPDIPPDLFTVLAGYSFPGNVRELRAMVFDAVARHQTGKLSLATFIKQVKQEPASQVTEAPVASILEEETTLPRLRKTMRSMELQLIQRALKRADGNQSLAASLLGVSRQALSKRLQSLREEDEKREEEG